jgi:hypothetical protein
MKVSAWARPVNEVPDEKPADAQTFPLVAVRDIPEIVAQEWLIEGLLPRFPSDGAAGYLFGPAKGRKSLLLSDLALSVATGTKALGKFEVKHTGTAVGFFAEDPKGETSRRIHRIARARGVEVPGNLHLINTPSIAIDSPVDQERLHNTLTAIPDLALVWLDPMVRLHRVNDNRAEELGPIHTFLRTLARACPSAVFVLAHHTNHEGGARGSTDYPAFGDFNLYCRKKDQLTTEITAIENRGGPPGKPFQFQVQDGGTDAGPTLALVASDLNEDSDQEHDMAVEQTIIAFRHSNPGASTREGKAHLRALGLKVGSDKFWSLWKGAKP